MPLFLDLWMQTIPFQESCVVGLLPCSWRCLLLSLEYMVVTGQNIVILQFLVGKTRQISACNCCNLCRTESCTYCNHYLYTICRRHSFLRILGGYFCADSSKYIGVFSERNGFSISEVVLLASIANRDRLPFRKSLSLFFLTYHEGAASICNLGRDGSFRYWWR